MVALFSLGSAGVRSNNWEAPDDADKIQNPLKESTAAAKAGRKTYQQMCAICHGNKGEGDGVAGMGLNPRPTDLTVVKVQDQSDGAIFWKMTEGRSPMASYKDILTEEQRWQLVNYIRTLN